MSKERFVSVVSCLPDFIFSGNAIFVTDYIMRDDLLTDPLLSISVKNFKIL